MKYLFFMRKQLKWEALILISLLVISFSYGLNLSFSRVFNNFFNEVSEEINEPGLNTSFAWINVFISESGIIHYSKTITYSSMNCFNKTMIRVPKEDNLWGLNAVSDEEGEFVSEDAGDSNILVYSFLNPVCNKSVNVTYYYFLIPGVIKGVNLTLVESSLINPVFDENTELNELSSVINSDYDINEEFFWISNPNCKVFFEQGNAYITCKRIKEVRTQVFFVNKEFQKYYSVTNLTLSDIVNENKMEEIKVKRKKFISPLKTPLFLIFALLFFFSASKKYKNIF